MKNNIIKVLLILVIALFSGCGGEEEEVPTPPVSSVSTVTGVIKDVSGDPLLGVKVSANGNEVITDINGTYSIEVEVNEQVSVTAELDNYAQNSRNVEVFENTVSNLDLTLVLVDKIVDFDVRVGATIITKGATVSLGASTIVNEDGSNFLGTVTAKVSFNQVTSSVGREAFPGDYVGLETNGDETVLQSYGFIDVTLEDENGNLLRLADGETATLTYPMDVNIATTPATIPLWYYDVVQGIWVEDGIATYDAGTNTYTGTVTHFTTWNLDAKVARAAYNSCIEDINGERVPSAIVRFQAPGYNRTFIHNDVSGNFSFINAPSGLPISLSAQVDSTISAIRTFTLVAGESRDDTKCLVVDLDLADTFSSVSGTLIALDGSVVSNSQVLIAYGDNIISTTTDNNGVFQSTIFARPVDGKVSLTFSADAQGTTVNVKQTYVLDTTSVNTNIGIIELKLSRLVGCVNDSFGNPFEFTGEGDGNVIIDNPYGFSLPGAIIDATDTDGKFSLYLPLDGKVHTVYAFSDFNEETAFQNFTANLPLIDLGSSCLQLDTLPSSDIKTSLSIVNNASKDVQVKVEYQTYEVNIDNTSSVYSYGSLVLDYTSSGSFSTLTYGDGIYLVKLGLMDGSLDFSDVSVSIILGDQIDQVLTVPVGSTMPYQGGEWFFFEIELYNGEAKIKLLNVLGNLPS